MYIVDKGCGYATGMKLKLPTIHLKRYEEIAALLWKYGRTDLVRQMCRPHFRLPGPGDQKTEENLRIAIVPPKFILSISVLDSFS
jgi:hypothetical protein